MVPRLTPKQVELLQFLQLYVARHNYSPTYAELARQFGVSVPSILERLKILKRKGVLTWRPSESRGLELLGEFAEQVKAIKSRPEAPRRAIARLEIERNIWRALYLAGCSEVDKRKIRRTVEQRVQGELSRRKF